MIISFTLQGIKHKGLPVEDSYKVYEDNGRIIVAVADGITRDPKNMLILPSQREYERWQNFIERYPRPSPAKIIADYFCGGSTHYLLTNGNNIRRAFETANLEIKIVNQKANPNPNYLDRDFWACVACLGSIQDNMLYYGFIADCGIAVFDKNGELKFRTENEGPNSKGSIDKDVWKKNKTTFSKPEGRRIIRSQYRNNPLNPLSYGALTGEPSALDFVKIGRQRLKQGDAVVFYSDGLENAVYSTKFPELLGDKSKLEKFCKTKVRTEGTLVAVI